MPVCTLHVIIAGGSLEIKLPTSKWTGEKQRWEGSHVQVKSGNDWGYGALLDVQMSICVASAGDCAPCQTLRFRSNFKHTNHHRPYYNTTTYINILQLQPQLRYDYEHNYKQPPLQYTTLRCTNYGTLTLQYNTLPSTTLHCTHLHDTTLTTSTTTTTLHYTTLH